MALNIGRLFILKFVFRVKFIILIDDCSRYTTGACNDNQTVMFKMSSSYSNFKMSIARILGKYAMRIQFFLKSNSLRCQKETIKVIL